MNGMFDCANHCNVRIYVQDTDSIQLHYDDVDKLLKGIKKNIN